MFFTHVLMWPVVAFAMFVDAIREKDTLGLVLLTIATIYFSVLAKYFIPDLASFLLHDLDLLYSTAAEWAAAGIVYAMLGIAVSCLEHYAWEVH